jgi:hypothetical protein
VVAPAVVLAKMLIQTVNVIFDWVPNFAELTCA